MDLGLAGKSALLIGAGRGLGGAAALAMASEGCKLALGARTRSDGEARAAACKAAESGGALAVAADATDPARHERAVEPPAHDFAELDVLDSPGRGAPPRGAAG